VVFLRLRNGWSHHHEYYEAQNRYYPSANAAFIHFFFSNLSLSLSLSLPLCSESEPGFTEDLILLLFINVFNDDSFILTQRLVVCLFNIFTTRVITQTIRFVYKWAGTQPTLKTIRYVYKWAGIQPTLKTGPTVDKSRRVRVIQNNNKKYI